ncbi:MAG: hypothetical protein ACW96U_08575 [Candidatus Heimdallarchaeaceae archaeon]
MKDEEKKGPGRPRKYDTDAERKKAYRERKKEERQQWEKSRTKRMVELQERVDKMERVIVKTASDEELPPGGSLLHSELLEQIKVRSAKYTPIELSELPLEDLLRIQETLTTRFYGSYYNPILAALETAIMPSVDREFDTQKSELGLQTPLEKLEKKLAKIHDETIPKTDQKVDEYIEKLKANGIKLSIEEMGVIRSTMEKRSDEQSRPWRVIKAPYRTDQLIEVFQELIMLYNVQAELSGRERDTELDSTIERLEKRLERLEKILTDVKERAVKESVARRKGKKDDKVLTDVKERAVKESISRRKEDDYDKVLTDVKERVVKESAARRKGKKDSS